MGWQVASRHRGLASRHRGCLDADGAWSHTWRHRGSIEASRQHRGIASRLEHRGIEAGAQVSGCLVEGGNGVNRNQVAADAGLKTQVTVFHLPLRPGRRRWLARSRKYEVRTWLAAGVIAAACPRACYPPTQHTLYPGGAWNHGTFRNHKERLYTVYGCPRRRLVPLYPFPLVYEKCGS